MKLEKLNPEHKKVLMDIQKSVPTEWLSRVSVKESIAPATREIMERALLDDEVPQETKDEFKLVLQSGFFELQVESQQDDVAALIDAYTEKEMLKAISQGKLPKPKKKRSFDAAYKRFIKLKEQYDEKYN
jgi:hypothetical protein